MTVQPTRDQLREAAEGHLRFGGGGDDLANGVLALLDQLDQAEADRDWNLRSSRIAKRERIEANARAERAEARIKAVRDVLAHHPYGGPGQEDAIRRALEG